MRSRRAGEVEQDISGGARVSDGQKVGLISLFYFIAQTHRLITFGFVTLPEKRSIGTLEEEKVIDRVYWLISLLFHFNAIMMMMTILKINWDHDQGNGISTISSSSSSFYNDHRLINATKYETQKNPRRCFKFRSFVERRSRMLRINTCDRVSGWLWMIEQVKGVRRWVEK